MDTEPEARIPKSRAALAGVLAIAAAVAVGHLVGGLVGPSAAPLLAVANSVVQLTQGTLKEIAVQTFGTADKPLLLAGIGVVLVLLGVLAGLLSRSSPKPGAVLIGGLGVVGLVAFGFTANVGGLGVLAPLLSLCAGVGGFLLLHRMARGTQAAAASEPAHGASRRRFLGTAAGVVVGALAAGGVGEWLARASGVRQVRAALGRITPTKAAPAIPRGADFAWSGTPTFITSNRDFYRVDTALTVPQINVDDWRLRIHGMVERERTFTYQDIRRRELIEQPITMTCVSNEVGGPYISTARFVGVPLRELLAEAGVHESAEQVFSTSDDGYTAGTPLDVVLERTLLAIGMNGEPLPLEHGFPARLVTPGLYGYVSATKWVVDLELTTFDAKQGFWIPRGYSVLAPVKTESRIDRPGPLQTVPNGRVTVAGIAWAQPRGISKVEVQVDDGGWREAELSTEVSGNTWRMWRTTFDLGPGLHTVRSRATDTTGYTQTAATAGAIPNGATGWPSLQFSVDG